MGVWESAQHTSNPNLGFKSKCPGCDKSHSLSAQISHPDSQNAFTGRGLVIHPSSHYTHGVNEAQIGQKPCP